MPLSTSCSSIYFTLEGLNQVTDEILVTFQISVLMDFMVYTDTLPLSIFPLILS